MNTKIIIPLILLILVIPLSIFGYFKYVKNTTSNKKHISKNILALTQPVTTFSGKVEKIE
ncbi:MAG: hypothetical protein AAB492_04195 [Patescibacteria group bacterium]